jgi:hypothetical protein
MESPKGQLGGWFKPLWFDKSLLILNGNFKKNYRLRFEVLYGVSKIRNKDFRKQELRKRGYSFRPQLSSYPMRPKIIDNILFARYGLDMAAE